MSKQKSTPENKFSWNEENSAQAVSLYNSIKEESGLEVANTDGLIQIATAVGAESPVKVRSKLVSAGVYEKADKPRKVGGGSSVRKAHFVRVFAKHAIAQEIIEKEDDFASLESVKLDALESLAKLLGVYDEVKEAAK